MFAVAFALDGTLVSSPDVERLAFARLCAEAVPDRVADAGAIERAFRAFGGPLTDGGPALTAAIAAAVRAAAGATQMRDLALAARYRQIVREVAADSARPLAGAERTLRELSALGVPQTILTNGLTSGAHGKARTIGFDGKLVVSEDTGVKKPDAGAFCALIDAIRLPPECIWYVASDYEMDISPAMVAGLNVVWLTEQEDAPVQVIRRVDEFLDIAKEPYTRSLLGLRYIMHTALEWRPGHFVPGEEYGLGG